MAKRLKPAAGVHLLLVGANSQYGSPHVRRFALCSLRSALEPSKLPNADFLNDHAKTQRERQEKLPHFSATQGLFRCEFFAFRRLGVRSFNLLQSLQEILNDRLGFGEIGVGGDLERRIARNHRG